MAYLLAHDETIPGGLRRIAREEIDAAIENLRVKQASKRDAAVHEARKNIKKLRGLVRLLMPQLGAEGPRENAVLRDLGRTLAEVRDAAAMIETVDLLGKKYHDHPAIQGLARVRSALVRRRNAARVHADSTTASEDGILALRRLRRRLNAWDIGPEFGSLAPGLKKSYRNGRRALRRARKHPDAASLHDLRKRVKDYWYQVRLLEPLWITPEDSPEKGLKSLQENLGDAHNLAVLRETAVAGSESVAPIIDDCERQLRAKSLAAARELYAEKPRAHAARLVELWAAWRGDAGRDKADTMPAPTSEATSAA